LVEFFPADGFGCVGKETGTTFGTPYEKEPIQLGLGWWFGFDEEVNAAVGVSDF